MSAPAPPTPHGPSLAVHSPFSGESLGTVATFTRDDLAQALAVARQVFENRRGWPPAHERAAWLRRFSALTAQRQEELALLIAREGGKPLADARIEMARAVGGLALCAEEATRQHGQQVGMEGSAAAVGRWAFTVREPVGVVAAFSAFNHPFNLLVHQAGVALAAGCPVLLKPSPATPLCAQMFCQLAWEAGVPPAWLQFTPCANEDAAWLAAQPGLGYLSYIGSARVGWGLRSALAPGVRCGLEHGGAAPVVVDESADITHAAPLLLKGGFYHAGQVCVSVQRVFAHRAVAGELARLLTDGARALKVGDPSLAETEVGPLIRAEAVHRVHGWVQNAVAGGATLLCGGQPLPGQCYAPTVLLNPPSQSEVMTQEAFGPVVCLSEVDTMEEAIARANAAPWVFQAAVFAQDVDRAMQAARWLNATAVMINDHTAFRVDWMPFGGAGPSGLGVGGIGPGVRDMTQEKLVVLRGR